MCNKEIGRPLWAFYARWEMHVLMVSEEVQTKEEKALGCIILGQDGGLEAYVRNNIIATPFLNPHVMPGTVLSILCV